MALQQFKDPSSDTYFGFDPDTQQGIAFSDPKYFQQYFKAFDPKAPAPTFDTSKLLSTPDQLLKLGAIEQPAETDTGGTPALDQSDLGIVPTIPEFKVDIPQTFTADLVKQAFSGEVPLAADIRRQISNIEAQQKSAIETQKKIRDLEASALLEQSNIRGTSQTTGLASLKLEDLQRKVATQQLPLTRELEAITSGISASKDAFSQFLQLANLEQDNRQKKFDLLEKAERLHLDQVKAVREQANKVTDNARQVLSTIITNFGGLAFEDLKPETQKQLQILAQTAGLPEGLLRAGMKTVKDRQLLNTQLQLEQRLQQQEIQNEFSRQRIAIAQQNAYTNALLAGLITKEGSTPGELPAFIQNGLGSIKDFQYIDMSKLTTKQVPIAQQYAVDLGIPLLSKEDVNKLQEAEANYASARSLLDQITSQIDGLITADDPKEAAIQAAKLQAQSLVPSKARTYKKTIEAFSALLTRAAGEKGTLATMDVQRIINALPGFYETKTTVADKKTNLDAVFEGQVDGAIQAYLGTRSKVQTGTGGVIGVPAPNGKTYYFDSQQKADEFKRKAGISFNEVGNTTASIDKLKKSIIVQESGGNYKSIGQQTSHGKALGKYQIIPKFHFSKIGLNPSSSSDQQKFLGSPQLQDKLFATIIDGLAKQYNNDPKKIAAAYYGGNYGASVVGTPAGNKPQTAGGKKFPSVNEYVAKVLSRIA